MSLIKVALSQCCQRTTLQLTQYPMVIQTQWRVHDFRKGGQSPRTPPFSLLPCHCIPCYPFPPKMSAKRKRHVLFWLKQNGFKTVSKLFWNCFVSVSFRCVDSFRSTFKPNWENGGCATNAPSGLWDGTAADIEFGAVLPQSVTSGGNNFNDFTVNWVITFRVVKSKKSKKNSEERGRIAESPPSPLP